MIAGAAAEIAFQFFTDGLLIQRRATMPVDHGKRCHDHAWSAEAALQTVIIAKRFLHGMQRAVRFGHSFDNLLSAKADNIFMLKLTYWLSR